MKTTSVAGRGSRGGFPPVAASRQSAAGIQGRVPQGGGFTLVELLVVIAIIAILAALLLPALSAVKRRGQIAKAQMEIGAIVHAIHDYETDNSVFPVSKDAMREADKAGQEDFTCGTIGVVCAGPSGPRLTADGFSIPGAAQQISTPGAYQTNNAEVVAILMDLDKFANGTPTANPNHSRNPKRTAYLNATSANDARAPGVGPDGVYRDPWGNPYIITMDLSGDNKARDAFYRRKNVSQQGGAAGYNGLLNSKDSAGNSDFFEANTPVMVWSAGPDKTIDPNTAANQGANKDNVLSWK